MSPSNDFDSKRTPLFCICHGFYIYVELVRPPRFNQTSAESTIHALSLSCFCPENHVRCLSVVRRQTCPDSVRIFEKAVRYPAVQGREKTVRTFGILVRLGQLQIVKFWEYDQIQKGSWFNDEAKQTELLLLSKSQSQKYCENIIGNTTLPYELWHLDDLKYESSLYSGQGWMKTNVYRANICVRSCSP